MDRDVGAKKSGKKTGNDRKDQVVKKLDTFNSTAQRKIVKSLLLKNSKLQLLTIKSFLI
jgi:hypothetical protein